MIAALIAGFARVLTGGSVRWVEDPSPGRQRVYFANHTSHADFVAIWAALPPEQRRRTRPVAAAEYWKQNALRRYLAKRVFRAVLIDRGNGGTTAGVDAAESASRRGREAIEQMVSVLREGESLIIFPEGTRGDGVETAPFKSGLYHLAVAAAGAELIPVRLENLNRVLPKGELIPVPVVARLTFGAPISLAAGETRDALLERARESVVTLRHTQGPPAR